jgi:ABC-2 type transport system permease protein
MMRTILQITVREWKRILRLPVHYLVLLVLPPILFAFYACIYQARNAEHLPVAIWDDDHTALSRQFTFMLEQTPAMHITRQIGGRGELEKLMQKGEVSAAIHFPVNMEKDIYSRHPVHITVYTNTAALVPAKLIYRDAAQVIITAGSGVILQKLEKLGMPHDKAMTLVQPIVVTSYMLYNPQYDYQLYLVPGLVFVGLQMMIIMVAVLILNYESKTNSMEELYVLAKGSASNVIAGKTLAHLVVAWINFILVVGIIFPLFDMSHPAATGTLFVAFTLLALACIGIGVLVSAIFTDVMVSCDLALFYTSPAFVFSGFTFPRWAMPWYDQYYACIMPFTFFLDAFFKLYFMELPLRYAYTEMGYILIFIIVTYPLAIILFQWRLNKLEVRHA